MLSDIHRIFNASFEVTKLKTEKEFADFFENFKTDNISERLNQELYNLFLKSKKQRLFEVLLSLSKWGLKSYSNWKLSFPFAPKITHFNNNSINLELKNFEKEITFSIINILLFLKLNFRNKKGEIFSLPMVLYSEKVLNSKYPIHSIEFKISRYEDYLRKVEKEIFIKYLYYSVLGTVKFQNIGSLNLEDSNSVLKQKLTLANQSLLKRLEFLKSENTLNYYSYINEIQKTESNAENIASTAFVLEENFTKEVLKDFNLNLSFKEEFREKVFIALKPYFTENSQSLLKKLLDSESTSTRSKIVFNQSGICLTYFLKELYNRQIIISNSKTTVQNWLIENFLYTYKGSIKDFTANTVQKTLFRDEKPPKHVIELNF
ncbi:hypothetical protein [Chryseobacterium sp. W4I1]|uniref:hypothetical protein n=1 Tax=Chryseobacterium sp. W4I1 TaxID=3042293 RepID=UPI002782ED3C|nr:hypothetical protein [Chryseobacterium sp. W4I1]MDQ0780566.1 hypothetical protein [Chryseobacterium sp. W4I1]